MICAYEMVFAGLRSLHRLAFLQLQAAGVEEEDAQKPAAREVSEVHLGRKASVRQFLVTSKASFL